MPNFEMNRRTALRLTAAAGLGLAGSGLVSTSAFADRTGKSGAQPTADAGTPRTASPITTANATRRPLLAGANPFVTLYDGNTPTAFASMWRVDWSRQGSGTVIIAWYADRLRIVSDAPPLAAWIEEHFVRNFDEAKELSSWPAARVERADTEVRVDPGRGVFARGGDITIRLDNVLDARPIAVPDFPIQNVSHGLSMQVLPCETATIRVGDRTLPGSNQLVWDNGKPYSSAVATVHEAWSM